LSKRKTGHIGDPSFDREALRGQKMGITFLNSGKEDRKILISWKKQGKRKAHHEEIESSTMYLKVSHLSKGTRKRGLGREGEGTWNKERKAMKIRSKK